MKYCSGDCQWCVACFCNRKTHTVPAVFLVEPRARYDERQGFELTFAGCRVGAAAHCQRQDTRLVVQSLNKRRIVAFRRQHFDV